MRKQSAEAGPELALYQPDIPQNVGAVIRLCAVFNRPLHIIEPCGFVWGHEKLKRSAMDYLEMATVIRHNSWEKFYTFAQENSQNLCLMTTKSERSIYEHRFTDNDILLIGRESAGVPDNVHQIADERLTIPQEQGRSLNMAISAAIALSEAIRQISVF